VLSLFTSRMNAAFTSSSVKCGVLQRVLSLNLELHCQTTLLLIPFALLGLFTGMKCCGHMNEKNVRRITTVLLILSGISLVWKNL
jgi:uncharacterized membrane protein YfcA